MTKKMAEPMRVPTASNTIPVKNLPRVSARPATESMIAE